MEQITEKMLQQKLAFVLIQSPMREELYRNMSLEDIHQKVNQDVKRLYESNFYQFINVHYGVRSKMQENLQEKEQRRKAQTLKNQIDLENQYITKLISIDDEKGIQELDRRYNEAVEKINIRSKDFNAEEFIPYIYIQAKQKTPVYGKIFQQFDRRGTALLKATIGYRSPFSLFDKLEFNMETTPFQYLKKRGFYEFALNWSNPTNLLGGSNLYVGSDFLCRPLFQAIDEKKYGAHFGFEKGDWKIELDYSKRFPRIHENISRYCALGYHIPSSKVSIKLDKTLADTIDKGDIMTGKIQEAKIECTLPFISQATFAKVQYNSRRFFDIYNMSQYFENSKIKSFFKNSNIETNFSLKAMLMNKNSISDFLENIQIRGFQNDRKPNPSLFQAKGSIKLNTYNYPLVGKVGITPFLFGQAGISVEKEIKRSHVLGSGGIGVSYSLGKSINLQLAYSLFQFQNRLNRECVNFQIRVGLFD